MARDDGQSRLPPVPSEVLAPVAPTGAPTGGPTRLVIVMGVAGCGKSTVGRGLAARLGVGFIEGDELHPARNVAKMSAGQPLTDDDRWPWLALVGLALRDRADLDGGAVAACSALRKVYRQRLAAAAGEPIRFVHLAGDYETIAARMAARENHFMPPGLLASQFETLETPCADEPAVDVDVAMPPADIIEAAMADLERHWSASAAPRRATDI